MGFLRNKSGQVKPDYTGLQIQTSTSTLPIPIVWGQNKVSGNITWYNGFSATPQYAHSSGKGGSNTISSYNYTADIMISLCEGPINTVSMVYKDQSLYMYQWLGFAFFSGTQTNNSWNGFSVLGFPDQQLSYPSTAYLAAPAYPLGSSASLGNHNFEIQGILWQTGANGIDADPAQVVYDFLTNQQYGAQFNPALINANSLFTQTAGDGSMQSYCKMMGIAFSPALTGQEQASSILTRWLQICNTAAVWSGGMLSFIPYGDAAVSAGNQSTITAQFSIPRPIPPSNTSQPQIPAQVQVCSQAQFVSDGGVKYASSGASLASLGGVSNPVTAGSYGVENGTYYFAPPDEGKAVIISYTVQTVAGFTPNLTPVYALGDDDFVDEKGNKDPLNVERVDVFSLPTVQRVEVSSRSSRYSPVPVEARDQAMIEMYGMRVAPVIQAHEICDEFTIGPIVAQTILQRELYVRTKFMFKLGWEFCLLDPMDIVTITDANLGLYAYPVRVISIEEDDRGILSVTAEELVTGVSTPAVNPNAGAGGGAPDWGLPAYSVNQPLVYEPPTALTGGVPQLWLGASGQYGQSLQWGGAYVWLSVDGVTFSPIATIIQPMRQGVLTSSLATASAGWDTTDTFSVDLTQSAGALSGTTAASAQQGATLSLIDGDLISYLSATVGSAYNYTIANLLRGMGATTPAAHGTGANFFRLDSAIIQYNLPPSLIGQTLYLKFQSFNAMGGGVQDVSACTVYSYTPPGTSVLDPIAAQLMSGAPLDLGSIFGSVTLSDDFGKTTVGAVTSTIDNGLILVATPISSQMLAALPSGSVDIGSIASAVTVSEDFGQVTVSAGSNIISLGTGP